MPEEFDIGRQGIDTQYERDYINYRPHIKYTPSGNASDNGLSADTASQQSDLSKISQSTSVIDLWEEVVDVIQSIDEVEEELSEKLKDLSAPISDYFKEQIVDAARELGYDITDAIPFELYRLTFEMDETPETILIQEAFEEYMSDVNGNLNAELYADVAEMKNDWKDMLEFIKKGLFSQIVAIDNVPSTVDVDDAKMENIKEKENAMLDTYAELLKLQTLSEAIYEELYASEYGSERFFQARKDYDDAKREVSNLEKRLFTKAETVDLVERKASDTSDNLTLIENTIDFDPYKDERYEILYGILKQYKTQDAMESGLKSIQALIKLSVDGKNMDVNEQKRNLRGLAGRTSKKKINQNLVNGVHLRNEIFTNVYDLMENLDGAPNIKNFEVVANHITDGIEQAEKMYQLQASDFYKIHYMDGELREDKLINLIDKDASRQVYRLADSVIKYSNNASGAWPSEEELSAWLNSFMEHTKLK